MVLNNYRSHVEKTLRPLAKKLGNLNPAVLSWLSILFAILAGYSIYTGNLLLLLASFVFILLTGFMDALDGVLARVRKVSSKKGDFLDHVFDRYADLLILGGITLSSYCREWIGLLGIIGVLMTSYMGTQSQAILGKRDLSGILGRANRIAILIFAPLVQYFFITQGIILFYELTFMEIVMIYFALAGNLTAIHRAFRIWGKL